MNKAELVSLVKDMAQWMNCICGRTSGETKRKKELLARAAEATKDETSVQVTITNGQVKWLPADEKKDDVDEDKDSELTA